MGERLYKFMGTKENFLRALHDNHVIIVYDLETTGLSWEQNHIIQLSARLCYTTDDGIEEMESRNWYINPGYSLPDNITELTGITDEFLADKPSEADVIEEIVEFFQNDAVAGYCNHRFDDKFMRVMFERYGCEFAPCDSIDVIKVVKNVVEPGKSANYKLATISEYFQIDDLIEQFHNAEGDTMATMMILNRCVGLCREKIAEAKKVKLHKCNVSSVAYWENPRNKKQRRIYVETDQATFFFDVVNKVWNTKSINDKIGKYDMDDVISQVLDITRSADEDELPKFKGRIRLGT